MAVAIPWPELTEAARCVSALRLRHLFGAQLKKKLVAEEDRADLLGRGRRQRDQRALLRAAWIATLLKFVASGGDRRLAAPGRCSCCHEVLKKEVAPVSPPTRVKRVVRTIGVDT